MPPTRACYAPWRTCSIFGQPVQFAGTAALPPRSGSTPLHAVARNRYHSIDLSHTVQPLAFEILTPDEMAEADRLTIASGLVDGIGLMRRAGQAVAAVILERFPDAAGVAVLAGPGNNGGDGYVIAEELRRAGVDVSLWRAEPPQGRTPTRRSLRAECTVPPRPLADFAPATGWLVVDALFGAGLARPLDGVYAEAVARLDAAGARVVAVDLPSGVSGLSGAVLGSSAARRGDRHLLPQEARPSAAARPRLLRRNHRRRHRHSRRCARIDRPHAASKTIRRNWRRVCCRRRQPTPTNMRAAMSACFRAGRRRPARRGCGDGRGARRGRGGHAAFAGQRACRKCGASDVDHPEEGGIDGRCGGVHGARESPAHWCSGRGLARMRRSARFALDLIAAAAGLVGAIVFDADGLTVLADEPRRIL